MASTHQKAGGLRVGDWVSLLYGPKVVLAQVIEDRGPLGMNGQHLYGVRIDQRDAEPTTLEAPEEDLTPATEAEKASWRAQGTVALHQAVTYHGREKDARGRPKPLFHYLLIAKPGADAGAGTASIISLSEAKTAGVAQGPFRVISVSQGGPEAALSKAEQYLDDQHPGLLKALGERRS